MRATAITDIGTGTVYHIDYPTVSAARAMVFGPYYREARIVLALADGRFEYYDRGVLVGKDDPCACGCHMDGVHVAA